MEKTVLEIISELNIKKVYSDIHGCMVDVEINQDHRNIFYTIWLDPKNRVYRLTENGYLYHEHKGCLIWPSAAREDWQEFYESKQPKEAVNARSQDEWNFVSQHLKRKWEGESFNIFNEDSCLDLHKKRHVDIGYCKTQNYGVLSFDEWCEREGIDNPFEDKVVVNVKSQEELDFVSEHLAYQWPEGCFNIYNKDYCIDLHRRRRYADMGYCKEQGYKILSFDEWCKKENISYSYIVNKLKTL